MSQDCCNDNCNNVQALLTFLRDMAECGNGETGCGCECQTIGKKSLGCIKLSAEYCCCGCGGNPGEPDEEYPYIGEGDVAFGIPEYDSTGYGWIPEIGLDGDVAKEISAGGTYEGAMAFGGSGYNYFAVTLKEDAYLNVHGCNVYTTGSLHVYTDKDLSTSIGTVVTNGYNWSKMTTKLEAGKTYYISGKLAVIIQFKFTRN